MIITKSLKNWRTIQVNVKILYTREQDVDLRKNVQSWIVRNQKLKYYYISLMVALSDKYLVGEKCDKLLFNCDKCDDKSYKPPWTK